MTALYIINIYSRIWFEIKSFIKEMIDNKIRFNNQYI